MVYAWKWSFFMSWPLRHDIPAHCFESPVFFSIEIRETHISVLFNILVDCHHNCFGREILIQPLFFHHLSTFVMIWNEWVQTSLISSDTCGQDRRYQQPQPIVKKKLGGMRWRRRRRQLPSPPDHPCPLGKDWRPAYLWHISFFLSIVSPFLSFYSCSRHSDGNFFDEKKEDWANQTYARMYTYVCVYWKMQRLEVSKRLTKVHDCPKPNPRPPPSKSWIGASVAVSSSAR